MTGSHIDTVRTGGRYDGNLGVLAGLEVVETLQRAGVRPLRPLAVAFFTNEEGTRFAPDMLGSLVYAGGLAVEEALDTVGIDGAAVGDELARIGYQGPHPCPGPAPHAFVELHIEQGPVLEAEGVTIGAVTGVQGISWQELTITGQSNHAGTTPMAMRHDAGLRRRRGRAFVRQLATELGGHQVGTVGRLGAAPRPRQRRRRPGDDDRRPPQHRRGRAAGGRATGSPRSSTSWPSARASSIRRDGWPASSRCRFDERVVELVEATAAAARPPRGAAAERRRPRRPDARPRLPRPAWSSCPSHQGISHNPAEHTDAGRPRGRRQRAAATSLLALADAEALP